MRPTLNKSIFQTRHSLLDRVKNPDDSESWREFVNYYDQYIYNILRSLKIPEHDANELCQDIIIKLWKKMPDFVYQKDRGKFRAWLSTVVRNRAFETLKKKKRSLSIEEQEDDSSLNNIEDVNGQDVDALIEKEWNNHISRLAWESVKDRFQKPVQKVYLLHIDGKSNKEISESCGIHEGSVRTYIARIRKYLREEIEIFNKELL